MPRRRRRRRCRHRRHTKRPTIRRTDRRTNLTAPSYVVLCCNPLSTWGRNCMHFALVCRLFFLLFGGGPLQGGDKYCRIS